MQDRNRDAAGAANTDDGRSGKGLHGSIPANGEREGATVGESSD